MVKFAKNKTLSKKIINQAVVLCGGLGSRLGNITKKTPKPLIKIGGKPFLNYIIERLVRIRIKKILLLCCYKNEEFFRKYHKKIINKNTYITCIKEKKLLGTGGALINAKKKLDDVFYLLNGDTFFDGDLFQLAEEFNQNKYDAILSSKKIFNDRYGIINIKKNKVIEFKDSSSKNISNINVGTYILKKKIINKLSKKKISLEKEIFPKLVKKGKIQAINYNKNLFLDIGIKSDLKKANLILPNLRYPAVFLDRDGVINKDLGYVYKKINFQFTRNIFEAIKFFNRKNYLVFIATNQSGIGRGYYKEKDLEKLHLWMIKEFQKNFIQIDDIFYSPYFKLNKKYSSLYFKNLRKPNTGMFNLAKKKWPVDKKRLVMIGDKKLDYQFGKKIGAKTIIIDENLDIFKQIKKFLKVK